MLVGVKRMNHDNISEVIRQKISNSPKKNEEPLVCSKYYSKLSPSHKVLQTVDRHIYETAMEATLKSNERMFKSKSPDDARRSRNVKHPNRVSGMPKPAYQSQYLVNNRSKLIKKTNFNQRQEISPLKLGIYSNQDIKLPIQSNMSVSSSG